VTEDGGPPPPAVAIVGDVATDVIVQLAEPPARGSDAAASITVRPGGSAANVAAWLARAGGGRASPRVRVTLVGRVGDDWFGRQHVAALIADGVQPRLAVDPERPSATIVALVDAGERTMLTDRGAGAALSPADLPADLFDTIDHLHLSGYTVLHEGSRKAGLAALRRARTAGVSVSVNASSRRPLERVGPERFLAWTSGADLCFANREEACRLTGEPGIDAAAQALCRTYGAAVVTAGSDGAVWASAAGGRAAVAAAGGTVRDPTGAGDAFTGGFLAAWVAGASPEEALAAGAALAGRCLEVVGGRPPGQ
jgi:sugar/nucleoside kinase (ribokinase family)